jgi:steroid 5-alpha reductase family enzyme
MGNSVLRNSSVFNADFSCLLAFNMALTVRVTSYFTIPLVANVLDVFWGRGTGISASHAFITVATSPFKNLYFSMICRSWTVSSSFEISTVRNCKGRCP